MNHLDSSPFRRWLHTNHVATADETTKIRQLCATPLAELARLEEEIGAQQARLDDLQKSYRRLKIKVDAHMALLSPVRSLPPELLQLIFLVALPSDRNAVMHSSEAPLLLGRVCSGWRKIAFATPELWSSLHIVCPPMDYSDLPSTLMRVQRRAEAAEQWLNRSGACPLSVSIWVSRDAGFTGAAVASASPFVEALIPLSRRWRHIELRVPSDSLDSFHYLQSFDVPLLQTLSITNESSLARDDWSGNLIFLQHAPRLHTLALTHEGNVDIPSYFPWSQLTSLSLTPTQEFFDLDTAMTLDMLRQCVNLETCKLHFPCTNPFQSSPAPTFTLPKLRMFSIRASNFDSIISRVIDTFDSLLLPCLETLELEDYHGSMHVFPGLIRLLSRSPCHLQKLVLRDIMGTDLELVSLLSLQSVSSLSELVIYDRGPDWRDEDGCMLSDTVVQAMSRQDPLICPNLRRVHFAQCGEYVSDEALLAFLRWRSCLREPTIPLEMAEISMDRTIEMADFKAAVQELEDSGLQVVIQTEEDSWDVRVSPWEGLTL
ncbi:hypothetical protein FB45DRAFT_494498 [Roridomyces roridus]|uniref:F-box domain-containing protein n=1 Tax=Roridomyces roridus TaxID=1738132 RepID=A0AAD7BVJ7_9AGAR|nr:hypothetical protein FB45DRAFT_494498 [Roridomyces roridus]